MQDVGEEKEEDVLTDPFALDPAAEWSGWLSLTLSQDDGAASEQPTEAPAGDADLMVTLGTDAGSESVAQVETVIVVAGADTVAAAPESARGLIATVALETPLPIGGQAPPTVLQEAFGMDSSAGPAHPIPFSAPDLTPNFIVG